jgi:hypothetical protein
VCQSVLQVSIANQLIAGAEQFLIVVGFLQRDTRREIFNLSMSRLFARIKIQFCSCIHRKQLASCLVVDREKPKQREIYSRDCRMFLDVGQTYIGDVGSEVKRRNQLDRVLEALVIVIGQRVQVVHVA